MEVQRLADKEELGKCAWCGGHIRKDVPVFGFGGKIRPGTDLSEYEGDAIVIGLVTKGKSIPMIVTTPNSQASRRERTSCLWYVPKSAGMK